MSENQLPAFIVRMQDEYAQLTERLGKLHNFMGSDQFLDLAVADRRLLEMQFAGMLQYQFFLEQRIHFAMVPFMEVQQPSQAV